MAASVATRFAPAANRLIPASIVAQIALAIYFELMNWLPFGSWNYQPGFDPLARQAANGHLAIGDLAYVAAFALPVSLYVLAVWRKWSWLMWIGLIGYGTWLVLELIGWWVPYVFGASDAWMSTYERVFSQSTQLLPSFGRHLAPDGLHVVLDALVAIVVTTIAVERVGSVVKRIRL